ncbi:MAG: 4-hydroxy-tetrahydrodipicolinate reductase [Phycisphaerae bacterium]
MINLAITGACGRMGQRIATLALQDSAFQIVSPLERADHPDLGKNYGHVLPNPKLDVILRDTLQDNPSVLIDFTTPESTTHWIDVCKNCNLPMIVGTTGLTEKELTIIKTVAQKIPIVQAPNMSIGMNLLFQLVEQMARVLGQNYDIEIVEQHHRFKKDAPSGSALGLLESIAKGLNKDPKQIAAFGRAGREATRKPGEVTLHALRLGDTVGEHAVHFGTLGETVTLSHSAHSRDTFAQGALRAAAWIVTKPPGLYSMQDVLFGKKE